MRSPVTHLLPIPFLRCAALALLAAVLAIPAPAARAQFSPVIEVNDRAITGYDLEQRVALLRALGAPGDLDEEARERLIDERLQVQAAELAGIEATEEEIREGIEEFAGRANTDPENFVAVLNRNGVATETFMDFVTAGVLWRKYVRERFTPRVTITDAEVEAALDRAGRDGRARVLLSEIILPARTPEESARSEELALDLVRINGFEAFAAAARNFSASQTRERGGRLDWTPLEQLPAPLRDAVLTMQPGDVTSPLRAPNVVALFQLRALEELPPEEAPIATIDYAEFLVAGGRAEAEAVAARVDTCNDLYGIARDLPPERLIRETRAPSDIPADVARELDRLDRDEISTALSRGGAQVLLMLCERRTEAAAALDEGAVRRNLGNRQVARLAESHLAELRANAVIVGAE